MDNNIPLPHLVDGFPRRSRLDLITPAEMAIYQAVQAIEALPPDERLTDAVILLGDAGAKVADFLEGIPCDSKS